VEPSSFKDIELATSFVPMISWVKVQLFDYIERLCSFFELEDPAVDFEN